MRLYEIIGMCLIVLVLLIGCYGGGFWLWAAPAQDHSVVWDGQGIIPRPIPRYRFEETQFNRALGAICAPVFQLRSAEVHFYHPEFDLQFRQGQFVEPIPTHSSALFDEFAAR